MNVYDTYILEPVHMMALAESARGSVADVDVESVRNLP